MSPYFTDLHGELRCSDVEDEVVDGSRLGLSIFAVR